MSRRAVTTIGAAALAGAGYYFYQAGGDAKTAQKMAEHDASKASAKIKDELPGSAKEAKKEGEVWANKAGAKIDEATDKARAKGREIDAQLGKSWSDATAKASQLKADAGAKLESARGEANKTIDQIDRTVEQKASEAKSGMSGWFSGSSKK